MWRKTKSKRKGRSGRGCGGRRAKVWLVANIFSSVSCSEGFLFFEHAIEKNKRKFSTSSHRCLSKKNAEKFDASAIRRARERELEMSFVGIKSF